MRHCKCKYCEETVDLKAEGVTYKDGTFAHEGCDDAEEFRRANEADLRDHEMAHSLQW